MIGYDSPRGGVTVIIEKGDDTVTSLLVQVFVVFVQYLYTGSCIVFIHRFMYSIYTEVHVQYLYRGSCIVFIHRFMYSIYTMIHVQYLYKGSCIVFMHGFMHSIFAQKYLFMYTCEYPSPNPAHKYSKSQSQSNRRVFTDYCGIVQIMEYPRTLWGKILMSIRF